MSVDGKQMRVDGLSIRVRDVGDGPPLLLINGLGGHTGMWAPLERALPGLRLIAYDAPGAGRSPMALPVPSIGLLADLAAKVLDKLGVEQADVLGYSLGGAVAQQFARDHPNRVRRLVLASTLPGFGAALGSVRATSLVWNPLRLLSHRYYERTLGDVAGGHARWDPEFRREQGLARLQERPNIAGYFAQIAAITSWSSLPWLRQVRVPTLVICGDDDPLVPSANSMLIAGHLPRARLVVLPNEGHLMLRDEQSAGPAAIHEFLTAESVAASATWCSGMTVGRDEAHAAARHTKHGFPVWDHLSTAYRELVAPRAARRAADREQSPSRTG